MFISLYSATKNSEQLLKEESFELPTDNERPQFESSMIEEGKREEETSAGPKDSQSSVHETTFQHMVMELHDTRQVEGSTVDIVIANPMASISGDISGSFVRAEREERSADGGTQEVSVACEGEEEVSTTPQPSKRKRCLTRFGQALKTLCLDLKLFFW